MREDFQRFWDYPCPDAAEKFLDNWVTTALQTDWEPMKKTARMLRSHKLLILNWFKPKGRLSPRRCGGFESQGKTYYEKSLWFQDTEMSGNRSISSTWRIAGA